ncbi:DUF167 domain-containing protein [Nitrosospira sp. Is2]|uniref:DUF167 domain-containing protein n=1 Tax=Nitrosospira sp. Is2 TaxID=3080532 RepID=UPI00295434A0|nr:DUF167 domain-containing protein [Nitrosospira sp. Is2]WON74811.1 DUF167 domain-containing protein [Nitrosospira sp. Is2]
MTSSPAHNAWCRSHPRGGRLTLILHIQPGAKRTEVAGLHGDALKIRVAAAPVEGAANAALMAFLAEVFGVPQCQVILKQGNKSRRKVIEINQAVGGPEVLFRQIHDGNTN